MAVRPYTARQCPPQKVVLGEELANLPDCRVPAVLPAHFWVSSVPSSLAYRRGQSATR
jgi:hypothetical protein